MRDLNYISLGAGVQSTAMLVLAGQGKIPNIKDAIFADTGDEPQYIYDYLEILKNYSKGVGINLHCVTRGILSDATFDWRGRDRTFVSMPAFTITKKGRGMIRRICTAEFKIKPINEKVRELMGYRRYQHIKEMAYAHIGISIDEASRMKDSRVKWVKHIYPLIDMDINRTDCIKLVEAAGLPTPKKSACIYCPYHSDAHWIEMKNDYPLEFKKACDFDDSIRHADWNQTGDSLFIHSQRIPLKEVVFSQNDDNHFNQECEGLCGV